MLRERDPGELQIGLMVLNGMPPMAGGVNMFRVDEDRTFDASCFLSFSISALDVFKYAVRLCF